MTVSTTLTSSCVAGCVAVSVVDLLEAVDVHEGERELGPRPPGALDLAGHLVEADLARPRARELVVRRQLVVALGFRGRTLRLGPLLACLLTVGCGPDPVLGRLGPVSRRSRAVALGPDQDVLPTRVRLVVPAMLAGQAVAALGVPVAKLRRPIAIRAGRQSLLCALLAQP